MNRLTWNPEAVSLKSPVEGADNGWIVDVSHREQEAKSLLCQSGYTNQVECFIFPSLKTALIYNQEFQTQLSLDRLG